MSQKFATFDPATGALTARYDAAIHATIPANAVPLDDATFLRSINETDGVWTLGADGKTVTKVMPSAAQVAATQLAAAWYLHQAAARAALVESDLTVLRCVEAAVAVPAAWATYRKALRAIIAASTGDPAQAMPTKPAYPAGT